MHTPHPSEQQKNRTEQKRSKNPWATHTTLLDEYLHFKYFYISYEITPSLIKYSISKTRQHSKKFNPCCWVAGACKAVPGEAVGERSEEYWKCLERPDEVRPWSWPELASAEARVGRGQQWKIREAAVAAERIVHFPAVEQPGVVRVAMV